VKRRREEKEVGGRGAEEPLHPQRDEEALKDEERLREGNTWEEEGWHQRWDRSKEEV